MSHLAAIGFRTADDRGLEDLLKRAYAKGRQMPATEGFYVHFEDVSGAALWMYFDRYKQLVHLQPHYGAGAYVACRLEAVVPAANPWEPSLFLVYEPRSSGAEGGFPFLVDLADGALWDLKDKSGRVQVQAVAFARQLKTHEQSPAVAQPGYAEPVKLLDDQGNLLPRPEAFSHLEGRVLSVDRKENTLTGQFFWCLTLSVCACEVPLLCADTFFAVAPNEGDFLCVECWWSGRLEAEKGQPSSSFWRRILGR